MTLGSALFAAFLAILPVQAAAGELAPTGGFSLMGSFLQMALALLVVVGLILLVYYGASRLVKVVPPLGQSGRHIRVLEVRPLGPRKSLLLVEVEGHYLLLAATDNQVTFLQRIDMLEEAELLDDPPPRFSFPSFLHRAKTGRGSLPDIPEKSS